MHVGDRILTLSTKPYSRLSSARSNLAHLAMSLSPMPSLRLPCAHSSKANLWESCLHLAYPFPLPSPCSSQITLKLLISEKFPLYLHRYENPDPSHILLGLLQYPLNDIPTFPFQFALTTATKVIFLKYMDGYVPLLLKTCSGSRYADA